MEKKNMLCNTDNINKKCVENFSRKLSANNLDDRCEDRRWIKLAHHVMLSFLVVLVLANGRTTLQMHN